MELNDQTFELFAAKHYDNPQCVTMEEFQEDLKRFQYIKRLFNRYKQTNELKERLILNHLIVLYNCFGIHTTDMLFHKLKGHYSALKPFLIQLSFLPDQVTVDGSSINTTDIDIDHTIVDALRRL